MSVFPPLKSDPMLQFTPANITQNTFGRLAENGEKGELVQGMKILMKRESLIELNRYRHLASLENGIIYMCDGYEDVEIMCKLNENDIAMQIKLHCRVAGIQFYCQSSVLIADGTSTLKIIESNGLIKDSIYHANPFCILAAHVTMNNKVIAGAIRTIDSSAAADRKIVMKFDKMATGKDMGIS